MEFDNIHRAELGDARRLLNAHEENVGATSDKIVLFLSLSFFT